MSSSIVRPPGIAPMRTLGSLLERQARERGSETFVITDGAAHSYARVDELARRAAAGFSAIGVGHGDRVCLALPNGLDITAAWLGLACMGAIEVPINPEFKSHQVGYVVQDAGATVIVTTASFFEAHRPHLLECPALRVLVLCDEAAGIDAGRLRVVGFGELCSAPAARHGAFEVRGSDPVAIMYTSGTTGVPKGVLLCHEHEVTLGSNIAASVELAQGDCFYNFFPMHHNTAQGIIACSVLAVGARMLLVDRFSRSRFWSDVHEYRCTVFYGMGAILEMLNKDPEGPRLARGHTLRVGWGIAMGVEQVERFGRLFGVPFVTGYGSTEANMAVMSDSGPQVAGMAGRPLQDFEVAIVDEDDRPCEPGVLGEIVVRPRRPYVTFLEYWGKPRETVQAWRNLWFHSGDAGVMDAQGRLFFVDRIKDVIRHRGNNVSSAEVESVLLQLPAVQEAAVVAADSELGEFEQEVRAVIVLAAGQDWNPRAIVEHCATRLPYYAVPRFLDRVEALPKTPTAKVRKGELRASGLLPDTWDRVAAGVTLRASRSM